MTCEHVCDVLEHVLARLPFGACFYKLRQLQVLFVRPQCRITTVPSCHQRKARRVISLTSHCRRGYYSVHYTTDRENYAFNCGVFQRSLDNHLQNC
ncbi:hypothetical protein JOB18_018686 [Solea senegalensis]|uniref:Uncharacterized protein n=1 Tax=Solea senegalensis TaxID=28829 RepID=A0AAV6QNP8_SOLSE|nr:hypothetical protein JOB18_018686 [Solea senegalensis]